MHVTMEAMCEQQDCVQSRFMERQQALLHGDLHTGSLMCTEDTTYVIDAEFAFCGPIAFDVGKMIANLLIAYFASWGLETPEAQREKQRQWLLQASISHCLLQLICFFIKQLLLDAFFAMGSMSSSCQFACLACTGLLFCDSLRPCPLLQSAKPLV